MSVFDEAKIRQLESENKALKAQHKEMGTLLFYAVKQLGGEMRLSIAECQASGDEPAMVAMRVDMFTQQIIIEAEGL